MKNAVVLLTFLFSFFLGFSQSPCESYYPIAEGEEWVMIMYDKKDKLDGYSIMKIKDKNSSEVVFNMEYYDKKGKESLNQEFKILCQEDMILIDMSSMIPAQSMQGMQDMQVKMEGDMLEMPQNLSVGMQLPDGEIAMSAEMNGIPIMNLKLDVYNRKVVEKVNVTISLGTYECFKLTQTSKMKIGFGTMETTTEEYWSPGNGLIKSVTYDKKGEIENYSIRGQRSDITQ